MLAASRSVQRKIVADYVLTEVGMQPMMPALNVRIHNDFAFCGNMAGLQNMSGSKCAFLFYSHMRRVTDKHAGHSTCKLS